MHLIVSTKHVFSFYPFFSHFRNDFVVSGIAGKIIAAVDINPIANSVYEHNFQETKLFNNNIQKFTAKSIGTLNVNMILMSPPCQPFTRVGNQKDIDDTRTDALLHICHILPDLHQIDAILMENVKGFECSRAREIYIETLKKCGFNFREFLLSPSQLEIPNTRCRYYCVARKCRPFSLNADNGQIITEYPLQGIDDEKRGTFVKDYVDENCSKTYLLPDDVLLKRATLLDIAHSSSSNTICFTKAYTHYTEGTGSVYCPHTLDKVHQVFEQIKNISTDDSLPFLKTLRLRYFTPIEVSRLMCFPQGFEFPDWVTDRQKYRLLGNSINVLVVSKLINFMLN